jgi:hypothetical protein
LDNYKTYRHDIAEILLKVALNIKTIGLFPVLLMEETGETGENHRPAASH